LLHDLLKNWSGDVPAAVRAHRGIERYQHGDDRRIERRETYE
jgi:hypothetical protein